MRKIYPFILLSLLVISSNLFGQIIPSEIMYNPPESGQDSLEYLELYNNSDQSVNLKGYQFSAGVEFTFPDITLASGSYFLLVKDDTAFTNTFSVAPDAQWLSGALSNGGELIELRDSSDNIIFSFEYDDADPWITSPDGAGASLELCELEADISDPASWGAAKTATGIVIDGIEIRGTPGAANDSDCGPSYDYRVEVSSNVFTPEDLTINLGETVLWENIGGSHNVDGRQQTYPNNPESFYSGPSESSPWEFLHTFNSLGVYQYECTPHAALGMKGTITVVDPNQLPLYDISTVTTNDQNGLPDSIGVSCRLQGVIHGANRRPGGYEFALIEDDGDGITVFSSNEINGYTATEGDRIEVEGQIGQFNGSTQINAEKITMLSGNNTLVAPRVVSTLSEETEDEYILLENVEFIDPTSWQGGSGSFNMDIRIIATNEVVTLRVDSDVPVNSETEPPMGGDGSPFSIRGIGGQFDRDQPYFDGYQIFPSYSSDFMAASNTTEVLLLKANIYPNPVTDILYIKAIDPGARSLRIIDETGKRVYYTENIHQQMTIELSHYLNATYFIVVEREGKLYYQKFIKQ